MSLTNKIVTLFAAAMIIIAIFSIGLYIGATKLQTANVASDVVNKEVGQPEDVDFSLFWRVWGLLSEKYVDPEELNSQERVWGAIQGMVGAVGDPYTVFLPPKEHELFQSAVRGDFEGVGMEIGMRGDVLTVISPLEGTPADRAGIKAGDKILQIDKIATQGMSLEKAVSLIRGPKGTKVTLTILHNNTDQPIDIEITRERIEIPVIETRTGDVVLKENSSQQNNPLLIGDDIYIIRLFSFSEKSPGAFRNAVRDFIMSGRKKLILDLRNNPGGYLEASVEVASWFLPSGKVIVREQFRGEQEERSHRSRGYNSFGDTKIVVLVNEGSASASEIVAGALRDHGLAKLVGTKTFGKGSVQELISVTDNTSLKVTVARWFTPNGTSISENGLKPDIEVKEDDDDKTDIQLEKAIEVLQQI